MAPTHTSNNWSCKEPTSTSNSFRLCRRLRTFKHNPVVLISSISLKQHYTQAPASQLASSLPVLHLVVLSTSTSQSWSHAASYCYRWSFAASQQSPFCALLQPTSITIQMNEIYTQLVDEVKRWHLVVVCIALRLCSSGIWERHILVQLEDVFVPLLSNVASDVEVQRTAGKMSHQQSEKCNNDEPSQMVDWL